MSSFTNPTTLFHPQNLHLHHQNRPLPLSLIRSSFSGEEKPTHHHHHHHHHHHQRRNIVTTLVATSIALGLHQVSPVALAESWGTRSFLRERFFEPGLSPEDAAARIRQTAEGLHSIREMLETMSWRYVLFYIRLKQSYLSQDMQNAMSTVPENRRQSYVNAANELVDNMAELYIRSTKMSDINTDDAKELDFIDNTPNDKVDDDPSVDDPKHSDLHEDNPLPTPQEEEEMIKKKYGGMLPKKPPLISKDHERAYFDSADWALGKQGAQKAKGPLEALRPKLEPTPHQQLRSRQSTYASTDDGEVVDDNNNDAPFKDQSCKLDATNNNNANSMD